MRIAMTAAASFRNQDTFVWLGKIVQQFLRVIVVYGRADGNPNLEVFSATALPITAFPMPAALSAKYVVKPEFQQGVLVGIGEEINIAAVAAIAAARAALRNELFPSERD